MKSTMILLLSSESFQLAVIMNIRCFEYMYAIIEHDCSQNPYTSLKWHKIKNGNRVRKKVFRDYYNTIHYHLNERRLTNRQSETFEFNAILPSTFKQLISRSAQWNFNVNLHCTTCHNWREIEDIEMAQAIRLFVIFSKCPFCASFRILHQ